MICGLIIEILNGVTKISSSVIAMNLYTSFISHSIRSTKGGYVHSSINNSRRPIPKNSPIWLDGRRRLVDDVFEHGVGGVELRYPGREL